MFRKKRLFIMIPALLLIPILLGMIPLNMAHKLAHGGAFAQGSQGCNCKNCPAHSLISHNHFDAEALNPASPDQGLSYCHEAFCTIPESTHPSVQILSIPLRC